MPATFMENKQVIVFVTSAERPRTLQQAFIDTLRGSQFLADAENAKRARAVDGSGYRKMVNGLNEIEPADSVPQITPAR
jgi:hypothetical protein